MDPAGAASPPLATPSGERERLIVQHWQDINERLRSVIGTGGMGALYQRALFLAATTHPLLMPALNMGDEGVNTTALAKALADQPAAEVAAAGEALKQAFVQVLGSLIGTDLTRQLLQPLQAPSGPVSLEPEPPPCAAK